jgi:hypothetical protein
MGLFVSTTGTTQSIPELGIEIAHPTTDRDMLAQFSVDEIGQASTLTSLIQAGTLVWRKVAAGTIQPAADYDPDFVEIERANTGPGQQLDRAVTFRDLSTGASEATPGFTWGASGNVNAGTYLLNDTVPSNKSGRVVPINGYIRYAFVTVELAATVTFTIEKRVGASFTTLATFSLSVERKKAVDFGYAAIPVSVEDEVAIRVSSGSCKSPVVGLVVRG